MFDIEGRTVGYVVQEHHQYVSNLTIALHESREAAMAAVRGVYLKLNEAVAEVIEEEGDRPDEAGGEPLSP